MKTRKIGYPFYRRKREWGTKHTYTEIENGTHYVDIPFTEHTSHDKLTNIDKYYRFDEYDCTETKPNPIPNTTVTSIPTITATPPYLMKMKKQV